MSTQRRTVKNLNLERSRPLIASAQSRQSGQPGIHEPSFLSGPSELSLGPPRSPRPGPINVEAGSSRSAQRTQFIDSESDTRRQTPVIPLMQCGHIRQLRVYLPMPMFQMDESELPLEPPGSLPPGPTNVEVSDDSDDLVILSPTAFQQGSSSGRSWRTQVIDVDSVETSPRNQRRRLDLDLQPPSVNFEGTSSSMLHVEPIARAPSPPPPPRLLAVPTYRCPICLGPMVDETTSTKCGHLFCDGCIRGAISAQGKCPLCRRKITHRGLLRVFFPAPI